MTRIRRPLGLLIVLAASTAVARPPALTRRRDECTRTAHLADVVCSPVGPGGRPLGCRSAGCHSGQVSWSGAFAPDAAHTRARAVARERSIAGCTRSTPLARVSTVSETVRSEATCPNSAGSVRTTARSDQVSPPRAKLQCQGQQHPDRDVHRERRPPPGQLSAQRPIQTGRAHGRTRCWSAAPNKPDRPPSCPTRRCSAAGRTR